MFQDLDATLRAVLSDAAAPAELRNAEVSFDTPDRDFHPTQPTVSLFLHEVAENRTLREVAPSTERVDGGWTSRPPSVRVDCTYLATTWSSRTGGQKTAEEHGLLGTALAWLGLFAVIEDRFLRGALREPPQPYPLPLTVAQTREGHSLAEFWTALGVPPRPAFTLTVTVALPSAGPAVEYPPVEEIRVEPVLITDPVLTGLVLDSTLAPVPAARVTVVEASRQEVVADTGRFTFSGLDFGRYTLRVVADPHEVERTVDYEADSQVHDVILPSA